MGMRMAFYPQDPEHSPTVSSKWKNIDSDSWVWEGQITATVNGYIREQEFTMIYPSLEVLSG